MRTTAAAALMLATLGACTSYQEIRTMEPAQISEMAARRPVMAACVIEEFRLRYGSGLVFTTSDRSDLGTSSVAAQSVTFLGTTHPRYEFDVTMRESGPDAVTVEWRVHRSLRGTPLIPEDGREIVTRCAAASLASGRTPRPGARS